MDWTGQVSSNKGHFDHKSQVSGFFTPGLLRFRLEAMNSNALGVEQKALSHFRPGHILLASIDFLHTVRLLDNSLHWCEGRFQLLLSQKERVEHL